MNMNATAQMETPVKSNLKPSDRLIVALDVPTKEEALEIGGELDGTGGGVLNHPWKRRHSESCYGRTGEPRIPETLVRNAFIKSRSRGSEGSFSRSKSET